MKKIGLFLFTILLMLPIFINATEVIDYGYFYKRDEQGNNINNAEFILRNNDSKLTYDVSYDNSEKAYKFGLIIEDDYNKLINYIPNDVKELLSSFSKMEDFTPYIPNVTVKSTITDFKKYTVDCERLYDNSVSINNYSIKKLFGEEKYSSCHVYVPTIMFIEETKTPEGYEKETAVLPAVFGFYYTFNEDTEEINNFTANLYNYSFFQYRNETGDQIEIRDVYKYDSNVDYSNVESAYNTFINYDNSMIYEHTDVCRSSNLIRGDSDGGEKCGSPIIIDKKGHSNISIESYVNNEEEVNLTQSDTVQIKVFLKNQGSAPSYDNVVVSEVPEGVEYVEGSANANGIYNPDDRTITWNLDYLDAHDGYIFAYNVAVTAGQNSNIYVTTSSVTSNDNTTPVESNEARVTTPGMGSEDIPDNPKTGDERMFVIILGLLIGFTIMFYVHSKRIVKL